MNQKIKIIIDHVTAGQSSSTTISETRHEHSDDHKATMIESQYLTEYEGKPAKREWNVIRVRQQM